MEPIKDLENCVLKVLNEDPNDQYGSDMSFGADQVNAEDDPEELANKELNSSSFAPVAPLPELTQGDKVKVINPYIDDFYEKILTFDYYTDPTHTRLMCSDDEGNQDEFSAEDLVLPNEDEETINIDDSDEDDEENESTDDKNNVVDSLTLKDPESENKEVGESVEVNTDTENESTEQENMEQNQQSDNEEVTLESVSMSVLYNVNECDCSGGTCKCDKEKEEKNDPPAQNDGKKKFRQFMTRKSEKSETEVHESFEEMKTRKLTEAKEKGFSV